MRTADVTMPPRPQGFTLIELMVALAIAALLLMLGVPSFTTFLRNSEIRSTSESIINGLRAATAEAANRNRKVTFEFASAASADWSFWFLDDSTDPPTKRILQSYSGKEAGLNTNVKKTPGPLLVEFNGLGRVNNPGSGDHIWSIDIESIVPGEARPLRIIVDDSKDPPAGKPRGLRMCDSGLDGLDPPDPRACK